MLNRVLANKMNGEEEVVGIGTTHVTVTVRNPAEPERTWEGLFLVDMRSVDCLVPAKHLRAIGLQPRRKRSYEVADRHGGEDSDIGGAEVEFMGDIAWANVIFGPDDAEPILGVTALESVGIEVDPQNQRFEAVARRAA